MAEKRRGGKAGKPNSSQDVISQMRAWNSIFCVSATLVLMSWGSAVHAHAGHSSPAMWQVCQHAKIGDECRFTDGQGRLNVGTCQSLARRYACVRNRPFASRVQRSAVSEKDEHSRLGLWAVVIFGVVGLGGWRLRRAGSSKLRAVNRADSS
ncbi:MAG: hypothetical protein AAFQ82_01550 [Myxococcota bacterium]